MQRHFIVDNEESVMDNGRPNSFWYFNAGHVVSAMVTLIGLGIPMVIGSLSLRDNVRDSARETMSLRTEFKTLNSRMDGIDINGTQYSRTSIPHDIEQIRALNERVEAMSRLQVDIGPRLAAIERDLAWTRSFLSDRKMIPNPDRKDN